jgi:hypothetical protein
MRSTSTASRARPARTATPHRASTGPGRTRRSPSPARGRCAATSSRAGTAWTRTAPPPHGPVGPPPRAPPRRSAPAGGKAVAQPPLIVRSAFIARPAQPRVELVLHRALNDQPSAQPRELRQRLARVLTHPHAKQPVDLLLDLRRRRYGTSHGVGLLHRLAGLEGTHAVALTGPALLTAVGRRDRPRRPTPAPDEQEAYRSVRGERWVRSLT